MSWHNKCAAPPFFLPVVGRTSYNARVCVYKEKTESDIMMIDALDKQQSEGTQSNSLIFNNSTFNGGLGRLKKIYTII